LFGGIAGFHFQKGSVITITEKYGNISFPIIITVELNALIYLANISQPDIFFEDL